MVRVGGRSRGCLLCRQKRIKLCSKCDEKVPSCSPCLGSEEQCPGALQGNIFLASSFQEKVCRKRHNKNDPQKKSVLDLPHKIKSHDIPPVNHISSLQVEKTTPLSANGLQFGKVSPETASDKLRPTNGHQLQQLLQHFWTTGRSIQDEEEIWTHFIHCLNKTPGPGMLQTWLPYLQQSLLQEPRKSIRFTLQAIYFAVYGSLALDQASIIDGRTWYDKSLKSQQRDLMLFSMKGNISPSAISDEDILNPMLLAFYELTSSCTGPGAWKKHLNAAAELMRMRGPNSYSSGFPNAVFRAMRLAMVYVASDARQPSFLAESSWLHLPFCGADKGVLDELIDILTLIPVLLSCADSLCADSQMVGSETTTEQKALILDGELQMMSLRLDHWWTSYASRLQLQDRSVSDNLFSPHSEGGCADSQTPWYNNPNTLEMVALYYSGAILLLHTRIQIHGLFGCQTRISTVLSDRVAAYGVSILDIASSSERAELSWYVYDSFRLAFPLSIVMKMSTCCKQRYSARKIFQRWSAERGITMCEDIVL